MSEKDTRSSLKTAIRIGDTVRFVGGQKSWVVFWASSDQRTVSIRALVPRRYGRPMYGVLVERLERVDG